MLDALYLVYGLGIFLYGMNRIERGLEQLSQQQVQKWLTRYTQHPISAVIAGVLITAMLQSSSLVTLLMMAFVSVRLVPLSNAIGVVLGANLGTTFTGWLVTTVGFKLPLSQAAIPLLGIGALLFLIFLQHEKFKAFGRLIFGLGCLLFGLSTMKETVEYLPDMIDFTQLNGLPPIAFLLAGTLLTAVIQSSSATMMITLTLLNAQLIALPDAAAFIIGADLGTTSTSLLAALTGHAIKKQLALAHVFFNLIVDLAAFIVLLPALPWIMRWFSGLGDLYQLVLFHSLFNLVGLTLFLPFTTRFERFLHRFFKHEHKVITRHIHLIPVQNQLLALQALKEELLHFLDRAFEFLDKAYSGESTNKHYEALQTLEGELVQYGSQLGQEPAFQLLASAREGIIACRTAHSVASDWPYLLVDHFQSSPQQWQQHYKGCLGEIKNVLTQAYPTKNWIDTASRLQTKQRLFSQQQTEHIYQLAGLSDSDELAISSLLNLNRELDSSLDHVLRAMEAWLVTENK